MLLQMLSRLKCAKPLLQIPDAAPLIKNNLISKSISTQMNPAWRNGTPTLLSKSVSPLASASTSISVPTPAASTPLTNLIISRNIFYAYRPNARKRIKKHGLEKRLSCRSQKEILFRRIIKGRKDLIVFPRFVNELPDNLIKNKNKRRVLLFSKSEGYKKHIKGPEYYKFGQ